MGLYDRDYVQAGSPPNLREGFANSSMSVKLMIVTVVIFLADNLFLGNVLGGAPTLPNQEPIPGLFALSPQVFTGSFRFWELLTYGFAHAPMSATIWHIVGNMYGLFFFGREVERKYGSREFLALYLAMIVLSGAIWCGLKILTGNPEDRIIGASGAITGLIVLFALHFPHRKIMLMFLPIAFPAWVLGLFIVGSDALGAAGMRGDKIAFVAHLAGAAVGALYFFSGIRLTGGSNPVGSSYGSSSYGSGSYGGGGGGGGGGTGWKMPSLFKSKPKLKVHSPREESLDAQADKILEKMSREGAESISAKERKVLDDYSRRVRRRRS